MEKNDLLQRLLDYRQRWERLVAKIPPERMTQPGAAGDWSVKDLIAHLTVYERWIAEMLEAHLRDEPPPDPGLTNHPDLEYRNAQLYLLNKDRPLADIQQESREVFNRLTRAVEQLDPHDIDDSQHTAALITPFWGEPIPLWQAVAGDTCEHTLQHMDDLHAWIARWRDAYQTLRSLRAVRHFLDIPVHEDALRRILQAGRWTGSAKNVQPWQFIVIRERKRLQELSSCGRYAGHLRGAALAIVLVMEPTYASGFDAGRAAQNMMLAAWAEGIGSCIASMQDEARAKRVLGVPEDRQAQVAISFGYPDPLAEDTIDGKPRSAVLGSLGRKPLDELVHYETWQFLDE